MGLKEDIVELANQTNDVEKSVAMELIEYSKQQNEELHRVNKRLFILLIIVLVLWFSTIAGGLYYFTNFGVETDIQEANTNEGGNACIGDNCYNGDIDYGESKKNN